MVYFQNSMSFFSASKSAKTLTHTLDTSCQAPFPTCSALMSSLATALRSDSNCGADYRRQNPIVRSAYAGLIAYDPLYKVSCFRANGSPNKDYCFSNAVTNQSAPSDSYVYYLPLGIPIPGGSVLTCSDCLKRTMQVFQDAASNKQQLLNGDYSDAARMVNVACGPTFVSTTVENSGPSSASVRSVPLPTLLAQTISSLVMLAALLATSGAMHII